MPAFYCSPNASLASSRSESSCSFCCRIFSASCSSLLSTTDSAWPNTNRNTQGTKVHQCGAGLAWTEVMEYRPASVVTHNGRLKATPCESSFMRWSVALKRAGVSECFGPCGLYPTSGDCSRNSVSCHNASGCPTQLLTCTFFSASSCFLFSALAFSVASMLFFFLT